MLLLVHQHPVLHPVGKVDKTKGLWGRGEEEERRPNLITAEFAFNLLPITLLQSLVK